MAGFTLAFLQTNSPQTNKTETMKIVVFPGSFDPFTKGHEDVVYQALNLFEHVVVGIGVNESKNYLFDLDRRIAHIQSLFEGKPVSVEAYQGLTVEFAQEKGAQFLIRGLRDSRDFSYERAIAHTNDTISGIKSVFLLTRQEFGSINATIVREIYKNHGDISRFVTSPELLVI
jgi:pantetheine-phosphate adenylyltransferase